ncbi:Protein-glutamate methylesterase/protein-glutamine glutaminase [Gammaproteobacteria bacterium]
MTDVLIVEDSRVVRDYLNFLVSSEPGLRVIGTAVDGEEALASVARRRPDVILMDIHMPRLDGLETTRRILSSSHPIPIVICTASIHFGEVQTAMRALEAGALAVLRKPSGFGDPNAEAEGAAIVNTLKLMAEVKVVRRWGRPPLPAVASPAVHRPEPEATTGQTTIVAIGASTGGPAAILQILSRLSPSTFPVAILLVQHISVGFTVGFAEWLAEASGWPVRMARNSEIPLPGHVYVAPDDHHLRVGRQGELRITQDEPHYGLRPSVGVLFRSVAEYHGRQAIGILLTGMGRDGAEELKLMANRGAFTIAQDEESCVVFGMPAEAIKLGAAQFVGPPHKIAERLMNNDFPLLSSSAALALVRQQQR